MSKVSGDASEVKRYNVRSWCVVTKVNAPLSKEAASQNNYFTDVTVWFTTGRAFLRSDLRVPPAISYSSLVLP